MSNVPTLQTAADLVASQAAAAHAHIVPAGAILSYAGSAAPSGWLVCDGALLNKATYPQYLSLFAAIGYTFGGSGDTFNLPDLRGRFVRYDNSMGNHGIAGVTAAGAATRDTGRAHGSVQGQATAKNGLGVTNNVVTSTGMSTNQTHSHAQNVTVAVSGGTGSRTDYDSDYTNAASFPQGISTNATNTDHTHNITSNVTLGDGDAETRPINIALNAIIKI